EAQAHPPVRALVGQGGRGAGRGSVEGDGLPGQPDRDRLAAEVPAPDDRVPVVDHGHVKPRRPGRVLEVYQTRRFAKRADRSPGVSDPLSSKIRPATMDVAPDARRLPRRQTPEGHQATCRRSRMFESRLQTAQFFLIVSTILTLVAIPVFIFGPAVVGVFFLVLQAAAAAIGCYLYAEVKGYPGPIGMAIGVAFGVVGALFIMIMPDQ